MKLEEELDKIVKAVKKELKTAKQLEEEERKKESTEQGGAYYQRG